MSDAQKNFLDSLPELGLGEQFIFACNETVACFNRCCAALTLPLTPYDIMRLSTHLEAPSEDFLRQYTQIRTFPDTGFPLPLLKMQEGPGEPCPFVTPAGCAIYEDRPGACRTYPLGRGTKMGTDEKPVERFFIVQEEHCCGFATGSEWTAQTWLKDQGLEPYNASNDRYMRLMSMVKASGEPISAKMATMVILCLFQLDRFRVFLADMKIFEKLEIDTDRCVAIMDNNDHCLDFAYEWLELVLFGKCPTLKRKA